MRSTLIAIATLLSTSLCQGQAYTFGTSPTVLNTDFTQITSVNDPRFSMFWDVYDLTDPHGETTIFTSSNISFSNTDGLTLKVTPPTKPNGKPFGSGIKSDHRYLYGRYELFVRVPGTDAPHASGWLLGGGQDVLTGGYREIDIFEHFSGGGGQESVRVGAWVGINKDSNRKRIFDKTTSCSPSNTFHTFRIDWTPKTIKFFVDGRHVGTTDSSATPSNSKLTPLKNEMRIRLDIVDGIRQGAVSQSLRIKSVKVYPLITQP